MNCTDYDDYEVLYDFEESEVESASYSEPLAIPDAFLACRRQLHVANIGYIAELAHTTKEEVALDLQGTALFQNPEFLMRNDAYLFAWCAVHPRGYLRCLHSDAFTSSGQAPRGI